MSMDDWPTMHVGRSWSGHDLEDDCPCPQEPCGLINMSKALPECPQHGFEACKTLRQMHPADSCPGALPLTKGTCTNCGTDIEYIVLMLCENCVKANLRKVYIDDESGA